MEWGKEDPMARVTGIGGIFFKARDPEALKAWYKQHLGLDIQTWGGLSFSSEGAGEVTVWSVFPADTPYFNPSAAPFMINYRVSDLEALRRVLKEEGCDVDDRMDVSEYGAFGWVMDPEGNRIELWQPPAGPLPG
jgi:predicted enzyme related to lactoylglutathione lyase